MGCDGDPLFDREVELAKLMEEKGVLVVSQFGEGVNHAVEFFEPSKANALHVVVKNFILSSLAAQEEMVGFCFAVAMFSLVAKKSNVPVCLDVIIVILLYIENWFWF